MRAMPYGAFGEAEIDPRCQCRVVHGNAEDDGECRWCERRREDAEAREALAKARGEN